MMDVEPPLRDEPRAVSGVRGSILRGGAWQTLGQFGPLVINLAFTPYLINGLGLDRYGLFLFASAIAGFLASFDGGIGASAQRYFSVFAGKDDRVGTTRLLTTLLGVVTVVGVLLFGILFSVSSIVVEHLNLNPQLAGEGEVLIRVLAVIIAFGLIRGLFAAVLNARQRFALTSTTNTALYIVYVIGCVVTVREGYGLRGIAVTFAIQAVLSAVVIVPSACRYLTAQGIGLVSWAELRAFLAYAGRIQVVGLAALVNLQADALIIGAFLPVRNVGFYGAGANFASQLRGVPINALSPMQASLANAVGAGDRSVAERQFERLQRGWVLGTSGWSAVAAAAAFFGVTHWLGEDFRLAGVVAAVLLLGHMVNLWTGALTTWLAAIGRPEIEARYGVAGMVVNVVLTVAFVIPFGLLGIVAATAASQVVCSLYLLRLVRAKVDPVPRSFLSEVPVRAILLSGGFAVLLEIAVGPLLPEGAAGLLLAGLSASPALVLFGIVAIGPAATRALVVEMGRRAAGKVKRSIR